MLQFINAGKIKKIIFLNVEKNKTFEKCFENMCPEIAGLYILTGDRPSDAPCLKTVGETTRWTRNY